MEKKVKEFRQLTDEQLGEVTGGRRDRVTVPELKICVPQTSIEGDCTKFDDDCNCLQWGGNAAV